jgi:hypothetical protein
MIIGTVRRIFFRNKFIERKKKKKERNLSIFPWWNCRRGRSIVRPRNRERKERIDIRTSNKRSTWQTYRILILNNTQRCNFIYAQQKRERERERERGCWKKNPRTK